MTNRARVNKIKSVKTSTRIIEFDGHVVKSDHIGHSLDNKRVKIGDPKRNQLVEILHNCAGNDLAYSEYQII